jgi:hypothetical protein
MKVDIDYNLNRYHVEVTDRDTWSAFHTLSLVIYPILEAYSRFATVSTPQVDIKADMPKGWRGTDVEAWKSVFDDILFAFKVEAEDSTDYIPDAETKILFDADQMSFDFVLNEADVQFRHVTDRETIVARQKRGLYLFAKYFHSLWD